MDPVWWLVVGIVVAAGLLGAGFYVGRETSADDLRRKDDALDAKDLVIARRDAQITELKAQLKRGTDAGSIAVAGAQDRADAAGAAADDPDAAFRLLAGGGDSSAAGDPSGSPAESSS